MPANLPPEYFAAEQRFKEASTPAEKVAALEELIANVPKHKGTDKLRADLRRKLSKLRDESAQRRKSGKRDPYTVPREGAAQAVLLGFTNSGKSSVLAALTNARPVIADYPLTTVMPLSGMMAFEDIQFQLVDLPPVGNESTDGWVSGLVRLADLIIMVLDLTDAPDVQADLLIGQINEWRIPLRQDGAPLNTSVTPKSLIMVGSRKDLPASDKGLADLRRSVGDKYAVIPFSSVTSEGNDELRQAVFDKSNIIRVYSKEPGKEPDMSRPFTLHEGTTVIELARLIHKEFTSRLKFARIWGSARFPGQKVQKDYVLQDKDIVEIHL